MIPLKITWRNVSSSAAIEAAIQEKASKLDLFTDQIIQCRVVLEVPHRRHHKGKLYHVRLDISVPGDEIVINREPDQHTAREDVYVSIHEAFDAARRQLQDYVRRRRGEVKAHEAGSSARVSRLFPDGGYGFLETVEGREVYFHKNSVLDAPFESIAVGMEVQFSEEEGEKGPQASTVRVAGRHA